MCLFLNNWKYALDILVNLVNAGINHLKVIWDGHCLLYVLEVPIKLPVSTVLGI